METTTIKPAEILAAAPDAIAIRLGATPSHPHPLAKNLTARQIAYAIGAKLRKPVEIEAELSIVARGMHSAEFAGLLSKGGQHVTVSAFDAAAQEHLQFTATTIVEGFLAENTPALDGDLDLQPLLNEFSEIARGAAFTAVGGVAVQLSTHARIVVVSRQLVINDQLGALKNIIGAVGAHAAQKEAAIIAATLNGNPTMEDGAAMFSDSNTVKATLDGANLGAAMGMLRNQKSAAGNALNLRAAHLVVSPELEYAARKTALEGGLDVKVAALAGLPAARWFVLPDPAIHPVLTVLRLAAARHPLRLEHKAPMEFDGTAIRVTADLGAAFLRRTGIVRAGSDLA